MPSGLHPWTGGVSCRAVSSTCILLSYQKFYHDASSIMLLHRTNAYIRHVTKMFTIEMQQLRATENDMGTPLE